MIFFEHKPQLFPVVVDVYIQIVSNEYVFVVLTRRIDIDEFIDVVIVIDAVGHVIDVAIFQRIVHV